MSETKESIKKLDIRVYPYYTGNHEHVVYSEEVPKWEFNDKGEPYVNGYTNIQEYIQSFADEVDINKIILSHLSLEQIEDLRDKGDSLVDTTVIPESIHEIYSKGDYARDFYNSLTAEQKAMFKNYEEFMNKYEILFKQNPIEKEEKKDE